MPDTPFRTPDEWRRAREAFVVASNTCNCDDAPCPENRDKQRYIFTMHFPCPPEPAKWPEMSSGSCFSATPPNTMAFNAPPTRPAPAEVEAALDKYLDLIRWLRAWALNRDNTRPSEEELNAARTRLLALYAEPVGELLVVDGQNDEGTQITGLDPEQYPRDSAVRVIKVEGEA